MSNPEGTEHGPFVPASTTSWSEVLGVLLVVIAIPIGTAVRWVRRRFE